MPSQVLVTDCGNLLVEMDVSPELRNTGYGLKSLTTRPTRSRSLADSLEKIRLRTSAGRSANHDSPLLCPLKRPVRSVGRYECYPMSSSEVLSSQNVDVLWESEMKFCHASRNTLFAARFLANLSRKIVSKLRRFFDNAGQALNSPKYSWKLPKSCTISGGKKQKHANHEKLACGAATQ